MEIKLVVQARKDGYKGLYPSIIPVEFVSFLTDQGSKDIANTMLGESIYMIAFSTQGCIFTKHIIVKDVQRRAPGYVSFSIFIENTNKFLGNLIVDLLDEYIKTYCDKYCSQSNQYKLDNIQEDWTEFEAITKTYESRWGYSSNDNNKNYQQGQREPAYIYYEDKAHLERYFSSPYREQYTKFKQIFFIDKKYKNGKNPLHTLNYDPNLDADLSEEIDLDEYKLIKKDPIDKKITITVWPNYNSPIYKNTKLKITWSREFCVDIDKEGTWDEDKIKKYIDKNESNKTITVNEINYNQWESKIYDLTIVTNHSSGKKIEEKEVTITLRYPNPYSPQKTYQKDINPPYKIKAEILESGNCSIKAKYGNSFSQEQKITSEDAKNSIILTLKDNKKNEPLIVENDVDEGVAINQKSKIILISSLSIISIFFIVFFILQKTPERSLKDDINYYNNYAIDIKLDMDSLNEFKEKLKTNSAEDNSSWWQQMVPFFTNNDSPNTYESKQISDMKDSCSSKIDSAIVLRKAIDAGEIHKLKSITFSEKQKKLKTAIDNINIADEKEIGERLRDKKVSKMNLDDVAKLIDRKIEKLDDEDDEDDEETPIEDTSGNSEGTSIIENSGNSTNTNTNTSDSDSDSELESDILALVQTNNYTKDDFKNLLKKSKNKNSKSYKCLNKICAYWKKFDGIKDLQVKKCTKINELEELVNENCK